MVAPFNRVLHRACWKKLGGGWKGLWTVPHHIRRSNIVVPFIIAFILSFIVFVIFFFVYTIRCFTFCAYVSAYVSRVEHLSLKISHNTFHNPCHTEYRYSYFVDCGSNFPMLCSTLKRFRIYNCTMKPAKAFNYF